LSDKAKALFADDADVFDAVVVAAERTLGLHGTTFSGEKAEDAKLAIVLELNFEQAQTEESEVYDRVERGERSWQYKANASAVHPRAQKIAERLLEGESTSGSRNSSTVSVGNNYAW
jgi:hypothetical protein